MPHFVTFFLRSVAPGCPAFITMEVPDKASADDALKKFFSDSSPGWVSIHSPNSVSTHLRREDVVAMQVTEGLSPEQKESLRRTEAARLRGI